MKSYNYILASASPRRRELLFGIIPDFDIVVSDAPEVKSLRHPSRLVMENARRKGNLNISDKIIISADTVVFMDGRYFLKPTSKDDAFSMLRLLSNRTHKVYTGVSIRYNDKVVTFYDVSKVKLKKLTDDDILNYINTGSPLDKAGAYGIQDNTVVSKYEGSFSNIMGLPIEKLSENLSLFLEDLCL